MPVANRRVVLMTHHALLREWSLGELRIPNRIVMAPMSTNRADKLGRVTTGLTRYLKRRAAGGCGLIVIESATVDSAFGSSGRTLRIDGDEQISGLRELVDELHETGAVVAAQLWHAGPRAEVKDGLPISPSGATAGMPVSSFDDAGSRFTVEASRHAPTTLHAAGNAPADSWSVIAGRTLPLNRVRETDPRPRPALGALKTHKHILRAFSKSKAGDAQEELARQFAQETENDDHVENSCR